MESVILVIQLIVAIAIVAVVLVQPAESAGFVGGSGSMSNLGTTRSKGDALSRITGYLGAIFFITSLALALMAEHHGKAPRILDVNTGPAAATTTAPKKAAPPATTAPAKTAPANHAEKPAAVKHEQKRPVQERPSAPISK